MEGETRPVFPVSLVVSFQEIRWYFYSRLSYACFEHGWDPMMLAISSSLIYQMIQHGCAVFLYFFNDCSLFFPVPPKQPSSNVGAP